MNGAKGQPLLQLEFKSAHQPFDIPAGWEWAPLSRGLQLRKESIQINDEAHYRRVTVQLHGRGIIARDVVRGVDVKMKNQQVLKPHDFLVAEIDAKMGGFGIVPVDLAGAIVSSHYFTFEINQACLLPGFLDAFVKVGFMTQSIETSVRGSLNYASIRPRHMLKMMFPFAPLPIQAGLVAKFEALDKAIDAARSQLDSLLVLPGAVVRQAVQGEL